MTGPRKLNSLEALAAYKERKRRDAQAPVGATEFDDSGDEDQDLGGFGSGRTIDGMGDGSRSDIVSLSDGIFPVDVVGELPADRSAPSVYQDMVARQTNEQALARAREEQRRARAEWEAVTAAARAAQREGSVDFSGTTEPFPDPVNDAASDATQPGGAGALDGMHTI